MLTYSYLTNLYPILTSLLNTPNLEYKNFLTYIHGKIRKTSVIFPIDWGIGVQEEEIDLLRFDS